MQMQQYIDMSYASMLVGAVTFLAVFFLVRFIVQTYTDPEDEKFTENKIIGISVGSAVACAILSLLVYKKYMVHKGSNSLLDEGFYDP